MYKSDVRDEKHLLSTSFAADIKAINPPYNCVRIAHRVFVCVDFDGTNISL